MMTRKDFEVLAYSLWQVKPPEDEPERMQEWRTAVQAVARGCFKCNVRFNDERFLKAAGYKEVCDA